MVLASEANIAWQALFTVFALGILAVLVGYLVRQSRRRARARREEAAAIAASLPPEYRFRPEPLAMFLGITALAAGGSWAAPIAFGPTAALIAPAMVIVPFVAIVERRRRRHRREIIESVRHAALQMNDVELSELVHALESHHGQPEMRQLRKLLGSQLRDRPA